MKKLFVSPLLVFLFLISLTNFSCNNNKSKDTSTTEENKDGYDNSSGKDEKGNKNADVSSDDIVGIYTITDVKVKSGDNEQDIYEKMDYCQQHNTYGFNKDGVWYLGGVASQNCTGPDESGTWKLDGNQLTINSQQSGTFNYTIESFDGKNLEVSSEANDNGVTSTYTTVFTKQ